jgi:hypothetical protein
MILIFTSSIFNSISFSFVSSFEPLFYKRYFDGLRITKNYFILSLTSEGFRTRHSPSFPQVIEHDTLHAPS